MAKMLDYCRAEDPGSRRSGENGAVTLGILAGVCFALPFGLYYAGLWLLPSDRQHIVLMLAMPAMLLWLASGILGLCGVFLGVHALCRNRPRFWLIVSTSISGVVSLISLIHVARGILQFLRYAR